MTKQNKAIFFGLLLLGIVFLVMPTFAFASDCEDKPCSVATSYNDYVNGSDCSEGCWVCDIFLLFFDAGNYVAYTASDGLLKSCRMLLGVGLGLWLAFHIMPLVASFKAGNAGQTLTKIGAGILKAIVVASFLSVGLSSIFDYIISPVTSFASGVSQKIMNASINSDANMMYCTVAKKVSATKVDEFGNPLVIEEHEGSVFNDDIRNDLLAIVRGGFTTINYAIKFAGYIWCSSIKHITLDLGIVSFNIPYLDISLALVAIACYIAFSVMIIVFPFYLIDAVFRVLMLCLLSPLFMVAWVFPVTQSYATKAFNMIVGGVVTFVIMGLVVSVGLRIAIIPVSEKVKDQNGNMTDLLSMCSDPAEISRIPQIVEDNDGNGISFFFILLCGLIAVKYIAKVSEIVSVFGFNKVSTNVAAKLGGKAAHLGVAAAVTAAKVARVGVNKVKDSLKAPGTGSHNSLKGVEAPGLDDKDKLDSKLDKGVDKAVESGAKGVEKGSEAAAKGIEGAGKASGEGVKAGGKAAGQGLSAAGEATTATVAGAPVGVALMAAGQATDAAATASGEAIKATTKAAAEGVKASGKAAAESMRTGNKVKNALKKAAKKQINKAKKAIKDAPKNIANKIKKAPKAIADKIKKQIGDEINRRVYGETIGDALNKNAKPSKPSK